MILLSVLILFAILLATDILQVPYAYVRVLLHIGTIVLPSDFNFFRTVRTLYTSSWGVWASCEMYLLW